MSSSVLTASAFTVVTQVYTQQGGVAESAPFTAPNVSPLMRKFLKGEPKALGIVQIMIGLFDILFGIVLAIHDDTTAVGFLFWGGIVYIISGALTVAAGRNPNRCLVKGSLVMNICCTITAIGAIGIFAVGLDIRVQDYLCSSFECLQIRLVYQTRSRGIIGVLLVFSILELIMSILVSAFAYKAVCDSTAEQADVIQTQQAPINTVTQGYLPSPTVNTHDIMYESNVGQHYAMVNLNSEAHPSKLQ